MFHLAYLFYFSDQCNFHGTELVELSCSNRKLWIINVCNYKDINYFILDDKWPFFCFILICATVLNNFSRWCLLEISMHIRAYHYIAEVILIKLNHAIIKDRVNWKPMLFFFLSIIIGLFPSYFSSLPNK